MDITVTESVYGALVPQHLLGFEGDASMQSYLRQVVERNYERGIVTLDAGHCQICCLPLTVKDHPRMKSSQKMTKKIRKLLDVASKERPKPIGKYQMHLVKKYLASSVKQVVKCTVCGHRNSISVLTNEAKLMLKEKSMQNVQQEETEMSESTKKKSKKKKKKAKKDSLNDSGLIIPDSLRTKSASPYPGIASFGGDKFKHETPSPGIMQTHSVSQGSKYSGSQAFQSQKLFSTPSSTRKKVDLEMKLSARSKKAQQKRLQLRDILVKDQPVQAKSTLSDFLSSL